MFSLTIDDPQYIMLNLISERTGAAIEDIVSDLIEDAMTEEYTRSFMEDVKNGLYDQYDYEEQYGRLV